jgi:hypothetical protein
MISLLYVCGSESKKIFITTQWNFHVDPVGYILILRLSISESLSKMYISDALPTNVLRITKL